MICCIDSDGGTLADRRKILVDILIIFENMVVIVAVNLEYSVAMVANQRETTKEKKQKKHKNMSLEGLSQNG